MEKNKQEIVGNDKPKKLKDIAKKPDQIVLNPKMDNKNIQERVVDVAQRRNRASLMRKLHGRLQKRKQISSQRLHNQGQLTQRSQQLAKNILRARLTGGRGSQYQHMSAANKVQIDQIVDKKAKLIRSMAIKMLPRLKSADVRRLEVVRSGKKPKGIKHYMSANPLNQSYEPDLEKLLQVFEQVTEKDIAALQNKSIEHNIPEGIVEMVFLRGLFDGGVDNAFNRVNSFLALGKAAEIDSDLVEQVWDQPNPNKNSSKKMSSAQKAEAKRRAKAAGRPYPNLVDNMAAMKESMSFSKFVEQDCCEDCGSVEETFEVGGEEYEDWGEPSEDVLLEENKNVKLNKPFLTPGGPKKRSVYVKNDKGNVVKVNFGDPNMTIKKNIPARRSSFRARHNCDNPGPKHKARYWSCRQW